MTRRLTVEHVLVLHEYAIQRYGGSRGILDRGRLESALNTPKQTMFGEELYPDVFAKTAILVYLLVKDHPFIDGNKRTALYAMLRFLEINSFGVTVTSNDDLYQFTLDIATSQLNKEQIEEWRRAHTVPAPGD
jgi:death-on-curing protein